MKDYPSQERRKTGYFARYAKALFRSGLIRDLGEGPVLFALFIASVEDRLHYKKAPSLWRAEIMDSLGIGGNVTFLKCRQAAVDAGLIHFESGNRVQASRYWSLVPPSLERYFHVQKVNAKKVSRSESEHKSEHKSERESERFHTLIPNNPICNGNTTKKPKRKSSSSRFRKPTVEEVRAYCRERGNAIDPQRFIDHYEANGWRIGRNPMKDWQAAIRTWEKNEFNQTQAPQPQTSRRPKV